MIISRQREKLFHAVIYFVTHTKRCSKMKLFKLLNLLDFEHYRQTGASVTALSYDAWPNGPVPGKLNSEIQKGAGQDFADAVEVKEIKSTSTGKVRRTSFKPKVGFNAALFSKRELRIMEELAEKFYDAKCFDMAEFSHYPSLPWNKVFGAGEGNGRPIPYELALSSTPVVEGSTIDPDEFEYRREAFEEVELAARGLQADDRQA